MASIKILDSIERQAAAEGHKAAVESAPKNQWQVDAHATHDGGVTQGEIGASVNRQVAKNITFTAYVKALVRGQDKGAAAGFRVGGSFCVLLALFASCSEAPQTSTSPTAVVVPPPIAAVAPSAPPAPVVVTPPPTPPVVPVNPVPPPTFKPFSGGYVNWVKREIGNPSAERITVTIMWANASCSERYGRPQTVSVPSLGLGTFEPPPVGCGQTLFAQGDGYMGASVGECRTPDFSSQQIVIFTGDECGPTPQPPTPQPPLPPFPPAKKSTRVRR